MDNGQCLSAEQLQDRDSGRRSTIRRRANDNNSEFLVPVKFSKTMSSGRLSGILPYEAAKVEEAQARSANHG